MGRAMMYIASVFSQLERETIAERIRDNMHELSKTGRWLGGTTPTGYASESLSSVTVDGKVKKACKLKPIPEKIQLVKTIFEVFMETGSLSKTDQYLLEHRCVTKRGKQFTRFAIRGILTNPVYMIADETAYQYLKENNVDLFAERAEFDGEHGVMAYNRTLQRPGKANQIRPMEEWIVAVGKHPGIIAGSDWVRVQAMLDVNKSKSYRRPRSNVALLSGLLRCGECGDYMRPELTNRRTADGELIYTYMCSTKERSHGTICAMKNCNGNTLDAKIVEDIRKLSADKETLTRLLAQTKKVISGSKEGYDAELALLREKHTETEDRIKRLVESLSVASETSAKYVMEQIDELHRESETQQARLSELEALTEQSRMLHQEFAFHQEMIEAFASAVDSATLEEKRRLLRTIVKKVVWDGKNAYVYLFAEDGEADLPPVEQPMYPLGEDSEGVVAEHCAGEGLVELFAEAQGAEVRDGFGDACEILVFFPETREGGVICSECGKGTGQVDEGRCGKVGQRGDRRGRRNVGPVRQDGAQHAPREDAGGVEQARRAFAQAVEIILHEAEPRGGIDQIAHGPKVSEDGGRKEGLPKAVHLRMTRRAEPLRQTTALEDGDRIGQRFGRDALCDAPGREVEIGRNAVGLIVESEIFEEAPCIEGALMMEQTPKDGKECEGRTDRETVDREFAQ